MNRALIIVGLVAVLGAGCASQPHTALSVPVVCAIDSEGETVGRKLGAITPEDTAMLEERGLRAEICGSVLVHQPLYGNPYMNPLTGAGLAAQGQGVEALQMMQDPGYIPMPTGPTPMERQQQEIQDFHRHQELIRAIERRDRHWRY